jgi:SAM-dependent methyltransferase
MRAQPTLEQVSKDSRERACPSLRNPNWLILRHRRRIIEEGIKRLPTTGLAVLDVGGRLQPYRPLLGARVKSYVAIDPQLTPLVNVAAVAEALPFPEGQFDLVICTQVLEYLPEPARGVDEIRRVLRPGGSALISAPSVFVRDCDHEYWRFLPEGLRYLLQDFAEVKVIPEGNSVTGLFRTLNVFLISFARPKFLARVLAWTLVPVLNVAGSILERCGGTGDYFTANFSAWVRK